ncbi:MAG: ubiquitin-conjugating enzyme E2 [Amphiamblys sp. WSBS2006]|nr:MAG: ubiquitin-conjugating enzyme E2 [Amphiamblys sp. WSBS2006]
MKHSGIVLLFAAFSVSCLGGTAMFVKRINREISNIRNEPASLISITMFGEERQTSSISIVQTEENNLFKWKATMQGPGNAVRGRLFQNCCYHPGGPPCFCPLQVVFKKLHPNIYGDGRIYPDLLEREWSPVLSTKTPLPIQSHEEIS